MTKLKTLSLMPIALAAIALAASLTLSCSRDVDLVTPTTVEATATVEKAKPTPTSAPATPTPTPTQSPTATPTAKVVLVETATVETDVVAEDFDDLVRRVYDLTIMLALELSPRQSATDEELRAAEFLLDEMTELGYETSFQDFEVTEAWGSGTFEILADDDGTPEIEFDRRDGKTARIFLAPFSPIKPGIVNGKIIAAGLGDDEDFKDVDTSGNIALVGRGQISFQEKAANATENGAVGLVVYNNEPRFYFGGRLDSKPAILTGGIPKEDGELMLDALAEGETLNGEMMIYPAGNGPSRNVIAELNNDILNDQVVLIGAHYDTTPWTQGANDNGSGVAAAMIVAEELADDELPFDLRFVFFGSEETGLHGSNHYAYALSQDEIDRIEAMINLDVVAVGDLLVFGDEELAELTENVAEKLDVNFEVTEPFERGASDYAAFDERGVPYLMFYADDLRFINHPSDTIDHIDAVPMGGTAAILLGLIERLADTIEP